MGVTEATPVGTLLDLADDIADALAETAIVADDRCTWMHGDVEASDEGRRLVHRTGDPAVYQGDAGIAWALAHAGDALGRADLCELAQYGASGALRRASARVGRGLHDGLSGVAIATLQAGTALADPALEGGGLELLDEATAAPLPSQDVIGGNAGALVALMAAYDETEEEWLLERGTMLGQAILEAADRHPWGWSWASGRPGEPGLCGLAHGAGGVAWALGELEARAAGAALEQAVREALRYERSWFDRRRSNWPDLRAGTDHAGGQPAFPTWWCHGSVGAGLVRLRLHELGREDPILLAEAAAALQSSVATATGSTEAGRPPDHGLTMCHGLGGTLELLLTAHSVLGEEEHLTAARWLLDRVVAILGDDVERWPDGLGGPGGDPSLMTGMAGTLILLLRAAGAAPMPSVGLFPCRRETLG